MRLFRLLLTLAALAVVVYFALTVPLGSKTLWQHLKSIAGSQESKELVDGVKEKAGSLLQKDSGSPSPEKNGDHLNSDERELLRKLIREKLEKSKGSPSSAPAHSDEAKTSKNQINHPEASKKAPAQADHR